MPATARRKPRIHLTAVGSSAREDVRRLGLSSTRELIDLVQLAVGTDYEITASEQMIFARENDLRGGRSDDDARVREIEKSLGDDRIAALVTLRGGAWFTRILERIRFDVLKRRRTRIHIFGFSEMTSLINIAGSYGKAVGVYDLGPGFLYAGMKRYVRKNAARLSRRIELPAGQHEGFAAGWALANYPAAFLSFFMEVSDILDGLGSSRVPAGRLLSGSLPSARKITIVGGNLSVMLPLIGSSFEDTIDTAGKWLAIEEVNEAPDPIDRMMAALRLSGLLERAEGIILGDFHDRDTDLSAAAYRILKHHLPKGWRKPIIALDNFGHIFPIAPLPMHREVTLRCRKRGDRSTVSIDIPWDKW